MGEKRISAEAIWNLPRVTTPVVDSVSGALYYSVRTFEPGGEREGREQIFRLDLKSGKRRPLTRSAGRSSQPAVSPDGKWLAFVRKIREREKPQLHLLSLEGGEAECVTHLPLGVADPRWLPDGSGVLFLAPVLCSALDVEETRRSVEARRKDPVQAHVTEDRLYRFWDR